MVEYTAGSIRVLILSRYGPLAASTRYRFLQYLPFLQEQGFVFTNNTLLDDDYLRNLYQGLRIDRRRVAAAFARRASTLIRARDFDLIWIYLEAFPWAPAWWEKVLLPPGVPYVVDLDDAMYHRYDMHKLPIVRGILGRKIDKVMEGAALVVAGNQYIADRAADAGARTIAILPTVVDLDKYRIRQKEPGEVEETVIGWIGSPATAYNLQLLRPALERLSSEQMIRLITVGAGEIDMGSQINLESRRWSETTEVRDIHRFDVGTMPLVDSPFERGKSGFKLIQCMACGLPVVASPVGVNAEIVTDGLNGLVASSSDDWYNALKVLAGDSNLRRAMGAAGRVRVEQHYSLQRTAPRLASLLRDAAH